VNFESKTNELTVDPDFECLTFKLRPEELRGLEDDILANGCRDALCVWPTQGKRILLDGHNRYRICQERGIKFQVVEVPLECREDAKLWILTNQLHRRNLNDDQRALIAVKVLELRAAISTSEKLARARKIKAGSMEAKLASIERGRQRLAVAKETGLPERKLRLAQEVKRDAPELVEKFHSDHLRLVDAKRLASLSLGARQYAVGLIEKGSDVRAAVRAAKKREYTERVSKAKPKPLKGKYRILYADPPWKYLGLNQADEYGHAERHYACLTDEQLRNYKVGGKRLVKDMVEDNAVLFIWVPSPMLEWCFAVIEAWGFKYKASFIWDKVRHNMGHYNSVRHEPLLICTRGSCKPDVPKLFDSVQRLERSRRHSEKPERFYEIIEYLYPYGRRLELFARSRRRGWDADGNEV